MATTNLTDILAAQRAYANARSQAMAAAGAPGADPKAAARAQHQAMLQYLQTRVTLLKQAREQALNQFDTQLTRYQEKIGQVQQLIQEDGAAVPPAAGTPPAASPPQSGGRTDAAAPAPQTTPSEGPATDSKQGKQKDTPR
jgi:hypothetical protein